MMPRFSEHKRLKGYVEQLVSTANVKTKKDKEDLAVSLQQFNFVYGKILVLLSFKLFFFLMLYASVINAFADKLGLISELGRFLSVVSGIVGTGISLLLIFVISLFIKMYQVDMRIIAIVLFSRFEKNSVFIRESPLFSYSRSYAQLRR
ncbi:MAG: hypothetical protein H6502_04335 [Candidatus Woesearchaeota archaeon]|nr:MAG: hypothetical protein H6502_04335 [Candidatus Woesearchaeota archaeon]